MGTRRALRRKGPGVAVPTPWGGGLGLADLVGPVFLVVATAAWFRGVADGVIAFDDVGAVAHWSDRTRTWFDLTLGDVGANRWRPVYSTIMLGVVRLFGTHYETYFWFNVALTAALVVLVYAVAREFSRSRSLATCAGVLVLTARFAYYQVTQVIGGPLETLALVWLVLLCYALWSFHRTGRTSQLAIAALYFVLLVHTHERFFLLVIVLVAVVSMSAKLSVRARVAWSGAFVVPLLVSVLIRRFALHIPLLVGTGRSADLGFTAPSAVEHAWQAGLQTLGINVGPEYLHGLTYPHLGPGWRSVCLVVLGLMAGTLAAAVLLALRAGGGEAGRLGRFLAVAASAAVLQIVSFSVTIRVEPRWIFGPFIIWVLAWVLCAGWLARRSRLWTATTGVTVLAVVVLSVAINNHYRSGLPGVYFMGARAEAAGIVEKTIGTYGTSIASRPVYVVDPAGGDWSGYLPRLIAVNSDLETLAVTTVSDIGQVPTSGAALIYDVTGGFHQVVDPPSGYQLSGEAYADGWVGREFTVRGRCAGLTLVIHPYVQDPTLHVSVTPDGGVPRVLGLGVPEVVVDLPGEQWTGRADVSFERAYVPADEGTGSDVRSLAGSVAITCTPPAP